MNYDEAQSLELNQPMQMGAPQTPFTDKVFRVRYYGFALCNNGDNDKLMSYSARAIKTAVEANTKPVKLKLHLTSQSIRLMNQHNEELAEISMKEIRSFARHREASGKTKFISLMTLNKYNDDKTKKYQCFMFLAYSTPEADQVCKTIQSCFDYAAELANLSKEKQAHDSKLTKLPNSPRLVRVGWD